MSREGEGVGEEKGPLGGDGIQRAGGPNQETRAWREMGREAGSVREAFGIQARGLQFTGGQQALLRPQGMRTGDPTPVSCGLLAPGPWQSPAVPIAQRLGRQSDRQLLCLFNILQAGPTPTHPLPLPPTLRGEARVPPPPAQGLRHQMAAAAWPGHRTETHRQRTHYCRQAGQA